VTASRRNVERDQKKHGKTDHTHGAALEACGSCNVIDVVESKQKKDLVK